MHYRATQAVDPIRVPSLGVEYFAHEKQRQHGGLLKISARIDVLDIEQFLAANLHERALFLSKNRGPKTEELISRYNWIIDAHETDPSLKISPIY